MCVSFIWMETDAAFNLGRSKSSAETKNEEPGPLLRGRNLNYFLAAFDYGIKGDELYSGAKGDVPTYNGGKSSSLYARVRLLVASST